jgi:hypothetical protein
MVFKKKVFKQKIGTKTNADDEHVVKRFTNGHKCFTSAEAAGMNEQQHRERVTMAEFERNWLNLHRPRNPLTGEETPREGHLYKERRVEPYPLIDPKRPDAKYAKERTPPALKVGVGEPRSGLEPEELAEIADAGRMQKVDALRALQDKVEAEFLYMSKKIADRKQRVNTSLVTNFLTSQRRPVPGEHSIYER